MHKSWLFPPHPHVFTSPWAGDGYLHAGCGGSSSPCRYLLWELVQYLLHAMKRHRHPARTPVISPGPSDFWKVPPGTIIPINVGLCLNFPFHKADGMVLRERLWMTPTKCPGATESAQHHVREGTGLWLPTHLSAAGNASAQMWARGATEEIPGNKASEIKVDVKLLLE